MTDTAIAISTRRRQLRCRRIASKRVIRRFDEANTTTLPKECIEAGNLAVCEAVRPIVNPSVNAANNRLNGYTFDAAGNLTADPQGRRFTYDAENKQVNVEALDQNGNPIATVGQYAYDGDGKRVKKIVPGTGEVTVFVYDVASKLIGEYSTIVALVEDAKVAYLTADHLGSPRVLTDENGATISRRDFHPFGEEIATPQRTQALGYRDDTVRQKFTGYERDNESSLDFAQARMYANSHGRFTAVDPIKEISPINPQTLNKYVYAINSPYRFVDRNGKWPTEIHNLIFLLSLPGLSKQEMQRMQEGIYSVDMPTAVLGYYANRHGMCKPNQGPFECAIGVMAAPIPDPQKLGEVSDSLSKHWYFGRFSHTGQDIVSPAHGFEVYDDTNFLACVLSLGTNLVACALFAKETKDHAEKEEVITQEQLNQLIQWQRKAYGELFGTAALNRGLGIFASARFEFSAPIDGRSLPAVIIDDLGVVTVYPDGREEYEGPLEKKKQ